MELRKDLTDAEVKLWAYLRKDPHRPTGTSPKSDI